MLTAGLYPKGLRLRNDVQQTPNGLRFGKHGIAFTPPFLTAVESRQLASTGFTIHAAFELPEPPADGFNTIVLFHNGDERSQLLIGQWRESLIVMNGDDYAHRRKTPRLTVNTAQTNTPKLFLSLAVHTEARTAALYLNGQLQKSSPTIELRLPAGIEPARLVLGNSVHANSSFCGSLSGFSMYDRAMRSEEVLHHYRQWQAGEPWPPISSPKPRLAFRFDTQPGSVGEAIAESQVRLQIPLYSTAVERRLLDPHLTVSGNRSGFALDALINLLGFMPFGFLTSAVIRRVTRLSTVATLLTVALLGGLFSFGIEYTQSWMPSRSSSLIDLLLNTAGTIAGTGVWITILNRSKPRG